MRSYNHNSTRLILAGLLCAASCLAQTTVVFPLKEMTGSAHRREIVVTSLDGVRLVGTNLIYPRPMVVAVKNGEVRTNLLTGNYRVTVRGVPGYSDGFVPDTNVVVYWNELAAVVPSALNLSQYYTRAQIDAMLANVGAPAGVVTNGASPDLRRVGLLSTAPSPTTFWITNHQNILQIGNSLYPDAVTISPDREVTIPYLTMPEFAIAEGADSSPLVVSSSGRIVPGTSVNLGQFAVYESSPYNMVITNASGAEVRFFGDDGMMSITIPGGGIWADYGFWGPLHGSLSGSIDGGSYGATNAAPAAPGAPKAWRDVVVGGVTYKMPLYQ